MNPYEKPVVTDYGTLVELTAVGGCVPVTDVPQGQPDEAYPLSGSC